MKSNLQTLIVFAALAVIFIGAANTFAQTEPCAGCYSSADAASAEVVKAANFAVKTQAKKQKAKIKLVKVSQAEQQVVAGLNYSLCMQIEVMEKGKKITIPQTVQTVVYLDLKQKYKLTSWSIAACTDEPPPVKSNE